jgi:hypothetical protein
MVKEYSGLKLKAISTLATRTVRHRRALPQQAFCQSQSLPGGSVCMVTFSCLYTGLATRALGGIHKTHAQAQAQAPAQAQTWRHTTTHSPYPTLPNDRALLLTVVYHYYCLPPAHPEATHSLAGSSKAVGSSLRCITRTILSAFTKYLLFLSRPLPLLAVPASDVWRLCFMFHRFLLLLLLVILCCASLVPSSHWY